MFRSLKIRAYVLVVQGGLILALGLAFLYLRTNMTDSVFDIGDVVLAVLLTVVALVVALLHFIIAGVLLLVARSRITKPMFPDTVDELKRDREWLKNLNQQTS